MPAGLAECAYRMRETYSVALPLVLVDNRGRRSSRSPVRSDAQGAIMRAEGSREHLAAPARSRPPDRRSDQCRTGEAKQIRKSMRWGATWQLPANEDNILSFPENGLKAPIRQHLRAARRPTGRRPHGFPRKVHRHYGCAMNILGTASRAKSVDGFALEAAPHRGSLALTTCGQGHRLLAARTDGNGTGTRH